MRTLYSGRQTGKTIELIKRSAELSVPIIVKDVVTGKHLKRRAKEMGLKIPNPISINSIITDRIKGINFNTVLVDDADYILGILIANKLHGCKIDTIALVARNEKGHELDMNGDDIVEKYGWPTQPENNIDYD